MIAAVQMKLDARNYKTEQDFRNKIQSIMAQIRAQSGKGRLLVVFPEHVGTFCLMCNAPQSIWKSSSVEKAVTTLFAQKPFEVGRYVLAKRISPIKALILARSTVMEKIYLSTFVEAAQDYEAWIVAGSAILRWGETNRLFNTSPIITPTGTVIHRQHKVNLGTLEGKGGLGIDSAPLNYLTVVRSPFGNLGLAIHLDAIQEEARKRLIDLDANILIQPSANNVAWEEWQQDDRSGGVYQSVAGRKELDLAINPMLVGSLWDLKFEGRSSIIGKEGYLAQANTHDQEEILFRKDLLN